MKDKATEEIHLLLDDFLVAISDKLSLHEEYS